MRFDNNIISGEIPTEIGKLTALTEIFYLNNNELCGAVPTELTTLANSVSGWNILSGNDNLGTDCS